MESNIINKKHTMPKGIIIILTGRTGTGKTEIRKKLHQNHPELKSLITSTTRKKRLSETDNIDYHFLTKNVFEQKIKNDEFVEFALYPSIGNDGKVALYYYGTTKNELAKILANGSLISTMEISGAAKFTQSIKKAFDKNTATKILSRTLVILIETESIEILKHRFLKRGGNENEWQKRLLVDEALLKQYGNQFSHTIINEEDKLSHAVLKIQNIINSTF